MGKGENIPADQFRLIFPNFNKMGLYGKTIIPAPVFSGEGSAVKIDNTVFLATLIFQVPGWNDAHDATPPKLFIHECIIVTY